MKNSPYFAEFTRGANLRVTQELGMSDSASKREGHIGHNCPEDNGSPQVKEEQRITGSVSRKGSVEVSKS
jgi:hypothetical protein